MNNYPIYNRSLPGIYELRRIPVGARMWFKGESQPYRVRASNVAFVILTKPFNLRHTVLYSIIDWESNVRGPEDLIFGMGAETDEACQEMLERLTAGETNVSKRHYAPLDIVKYDNQPN